MRHLTVVIFAAASLVGPLSTSALAEIRSLHELTADDFLRLKRLGLADSDLAAACSATEDDVREIRRRCAAVGKASSAAVAREFGVTQQAVFRIVKRLNWAHVA